MREIRACTLCAQALPLGPKPVLAISPTARLLIAGQAPGIRVHQSGIPWNDPSGINLRRWLDMDPEVFYDGSRVAIAPMGFCYPGTGKRGDLPPRPECALAWRARVMASLPAVRLVLAIGQYAQAYHLGKRRDNTLTDTLRNWRAHAQTGIIPLPHPSPRNRKWMMDRPWFEAEILPAVRKAVWDCLLGH